MVRQRVARIEHPLDLELALVVGQVRDGTLETRRGRNVAIEIVYRLRTDGLQHGRAVVCGEGEVAHHNTFFVISAASCRAA